MYYVDLYKTYISFAFKRESLVNRVTMGKGEEKINLNN